MRNNPSEYERVISEAIDEANRLAQESGRTHTVVILPDGDPTVVTEEVRLLANALDHGVEGSAIYTSSSYGPNQFPRRGDVEAIWWPLKNLKVEDYEKVPGAFKVGEWTGQSRVKRGVLEARLVDIEFNPNLDLDQASVVRGQPVLAFDETKIEQHIEASIRRWVPEGTKEEGIKTLLQKTMDGEDIRCCFEKDGSVTFFDTEEEYQASVKASAEAEYKAAEAKDTASDSPSQAFEVRNADGQPIATGDTVREVLGQLKLVRSVLIKHKLWPSVDDIREGDAEYIANVIDTAAELGRGLVDPRLTVWEDGVQVEATPHEEREQIKRTVAY